MEDKFVVFKTGRNELTKVNISEILYLKANGNYTYIKTTTGELTGILLNISKLKPSPSCISQNIKSGVSLG